MMGFGSSFKKALSKVAKYDPIIRTTQSSIEHTAKAIDSTSLGEKDKWNKWVLSSHDGATAGTITPQQAGHQLGQAAVVASVVAGGMALAGSGAAGGGAAAAGEAAAVGADAALLSPTGYGMSIAGGGGMSTAGTLASGSLAGYGGTLGSIGAGLSVTSPWWATAASTAGDFLSGTASAAGKSLLLSALKPKQEAQAAGPQELEPIRSEPLDLRTPKQQANQNGALLVLLASAGLLIAGIVK